MAPGLLLGLAGRPGPELVAALTEAVSGGLGLGVVPEGASSAPWRRTVRVFSAGRRLEGWVVWCRLRDLAALVLAWTANPPIDSGCGPDPDAGPEADSDAEAGPEPVEGFHGDDRCQGREPEASGAVASGGAGA